MVNSGKSPDLLTKFALKNSLESSNFPSGPGHTGKSSSVLVKAPQEPPLKTVKKIGHPGTADFLHSFEGGVPPLKSVQ